MGLPELERASRLEQLAARARSLRAELGRGPSAEETGSPEKAAALELIDACDPLHGAALVSEPEDRKAAEGTGMLAELVQVVLDTVELAPDFAKSLADRQQLLLRFALPCITHGQVAWEVVIAQCCNARLDDVVHFGHASKHFVNTTAVVDQPLLQLLASHDALCSHRMSSQASSHLVVVATAEIPWELWQDAFGGRSRVRAPLLAAAGPHERPALVGSAQVILGKVPDGMPDDMPVGRLEPCGVHLKVWLEDLRLRGLPRGIHIVVKLGAQQEIVAHPEGLLERSELVAPIHVAAVAESCTWSFDAARKMQLFGPVPEKLFFQIWRGQELLGLAGLPVPVLSEGMIQDLCSGRRCVEAADAELTVTSTCAGDTLGILRVKLYAERASPSFRSCAVGSRLGCARPKNQPEESHPESAPRDCCSRVELVAPLSEKEVAEWFGHMFQHHLSAALQIAPQRVNILGVEGSSLVFEIEPGHADEISPAAAVQEFARQLCCADSPLADGQLAQFLAAYKSRLIKQPSPPPFAEEPSSNQGRLPQDASFSKPRRNCSAASPGVGPHPVQLPLEFDNVLSVVKQRLFEVVHASGVEASRAFAVLDRDGDGLATVADMVALLHHLGLPLTEEVVELAHLSPPDSGFLNGDFRRQYQAWLQQLPEPAIPPEGLLLPNEAGERCLLLPDFLLFSTLDTDGSGRVEPEIWRSFAMRCLGLGADAAVAAYSFCDQHHLGALTYRDFRRYVAFVDHLKVQQEAMPHTDAIRRDLRTLLELAELQDSDEPGRLILVSEALGSRGRSIDTEAGLAGLQELLADLRLPPHVAGLLLEWQEAISVAVRVAKGLSGPLPMTYRRLINILQASRALVLTHLDGLFGACMVAGIDLPSVLNFALRRSSQALSVEELAGSLVASGVDLKTVDPKDVLLALDPYDCKQISAPELLRAFEKFQSKFGGMLSSIASRMGSRGLSKDQFIPVHSKCISFGHPVSCI
ncbi:unnamed protein product [Effrenium voratum]|nr:unnamed protein product [Effrenium voratum]